MFRVGTILVKSATLLLLVVCTSHGVRLQAGSIEATKGKKYGITKQHGPWMIMVATLREAPEKMKTEGISPEQAADELVYELRTRGVPAYVIKRDEALTNVLTTNKQGKEEERKYRLTEEYCVLAGNYASFDDPVINKTLEYIKKIHPECMKQGAIYRPRENQTGPLSHAFKTINPLLSQDEVALMKKDPEIEYMNNDMGNLSLLKQSGKYSVVVATFAGKSVYSKSANEAKKMKEKLDSLDAKNDAGSSFDAMYIEAWTLAKMLREKNIEAYVYHDRFKSVVTVGSFTADNDPAIQQIKEKFSAKHKTNPKTGKIELLGEVFLLPASKNKIATVGNLVPGYSAEKEAPKMVVFDPNPRLVQIMGTKLRQVEY